MALQALDMGHVSSHMIFSNSCEIVTPEKGHRLEDFSACPLRICADGRWPVKLEGGLSELSNQKTSIPAAT